MTDYQNLYSTIKDGSAQLLQTLGIPPQLSGMFTPLLAKFIAPPNSRINDYFWPTAGRSHSRAAVSFIADRVDSSSNLYASRFNAYQKDQALGTAYMLLGHNQADIHNLVAQANGQFMNPYAMGYDFLDPFGAQAGASAAQNLAGIARRTRIGYALSNAPAYSQLNTALFGSLDDYETVYTASGDKYHRLKSGVDGGILNDVMVNPRQYGNLSAANVMALGQEMMLTDSTNYFSKNQNGQLTFQAQRFREELKQMSNALKPWQDVLGNDIPELLKQMEALTGQGLRNNVTSMGNYGFKLSAILNQTGATIQHVAAYRDALAPSLADPTGMNHSILGAAAVAANMTMGMANNAGPAAMTIPEFQQLAAKLSTGTAKSAFAQRFAQGFAAFMDQNRDMDYEAGMAEFQKRYTNAFGTSGSHNAALAAASGIRNTRDLENYTSSGAYLYAIKSGDNALVAQDTMVQAATNAVQREVSNRSFGKMFQGWDTAKWAEFLGSDWDAQRTALEGMGVARNTSAGMVRELRQLASYGLGVAGMGGQSTDQAQGVFSTYTRSMSTRGPVQQQKEFMQRVAELASPGGIRGVFEAAKAKNGSISWTDAIKAWAGGDAYLNVLADEAAFGTDNDASAAYGRILSKYYDQLGDDNNALSALRAGLVSGNADTKMRAVNAMKSLDALSSDLSDLDKTFVNDLLKLTAPLSQLEVRDKFMDHTVLKMLDEKPLSGTTQVAIANLMASTQVESLAQLQNTDGWKQLSKEGQEAIADALRGKLGKVDGEEPISKLVESINELIMTLKTWVNGSKDK